MTYADDQSAIQVLRAGACGFLTKDATNQQIAAALQAAKRGESAIEPAVQHHLVKAIAPHRAAAPTQGRDPAVVDGPPGRPGSGGGWQAPGLELGRWFWPCRHRRGSERPDAGKD